MLSFLGLIITGLIGAAAWLYQKAWERQQQRVARYQEIIDRTLAFTLGGLDPGKVDETLSELRRLWLFAPDNVVRAANAFLAATSAGEGTPERLAAANNAFKVLMLAMRKDASFKAALFPEFFTSRLGAEDIVIASARKHRALPGAAPVKDEPADTGC
jgi:hypothetical protein